MTPFAALLPVGPGELERARAADVLESLLVHEPELSCCVLVDDAPEDRRLDRLVPFSRACRVVSLPSPRQGRVRGHLKGMATNIMLALRWIHDNARPRFVLKLDTDTLVIAPFAEKIAAAFETRPEVGMVGAYDRLCNGEPRDFTPKALYMRKLMAPVSLWWEPLTPGQYVRLAGWGRAATIRRHIASAVARGYRLGEHCLGAAYALSSEMIGRMAAEGYLGDPLLWLRTHGEDAVMGMYTRAVGLELRGLVGPGEPFGVRWRGLPDAPERLLANGHSLIHSVKNDPRFSEGDVRRFCREHRARPRG